MPKWLPLRTATTPTPCSPALRTASRAAYAVTTCPTPSRPSSKATAPPSTTVATSVTARITPERSRAAYHSRRSIPCEGCPHASAVTRLSATSRASGSGTPSEARTAVPKQISSDGGIMTGS